MNDLTIHKPAPATPAVESGLTYLPRSVARQLSQAPNRDAIIAECRTVLSAEKPAEPEAFALTVERLALHYPENKLTPQERKHVLKDWRRLMGHLPADILGAAVDAYVMTAARFFPTPGQLDAIASPMWAYRQALARRAGETLNLMGEQP